MKYAELISMRIRILCRQRGISYNKLATMSGLRQSTIDNILRGVSSNPTIKTLHRVAVAFNMTLSEFLDFNELNQYSFDDEDND